MNFSSCPHDPDATIEAYLVGKLRRDAAISFEEHYLSCPRCSDRLQFTEVFVKAYQRAAERTQQSYLER